MPVTFSELLADAELGVDNRRALLALYDEVKAAVAAGDLTLEGHSLPASLNQWLERLPGRQRALKHDRDVVDFSLADDAALARWRQRRLHDLRRRERGARTRTVSPAARDLFERVKALDEANARSLESTNGRKEELLGALSDLQAAVALFLQSYDRNRQRLRLPDRELPLERVRARASAPSRSKPAEAKAAPPKGRAAKSG